MNPGQKQFFDFIVERTQPDKANDMKALLEENFQRQDNGTFTPDYLAASMPKLYAMLKPEHVDEVKAITAQFGKNMTQ